MPIIAIMSGGDWYDASVEFRVSISSTSESIDKLQEEYQIWYNNGCLDDEGERAYMSFADYLLHHGYREPDKNEVVEIWEQ